jgi:uncharacterized protein
MMGNTLRIIGIVSIVLAGLSAAEADPSLSGSDNSDVAGHWEGAVELPGSPLSISVDLVYNDGYWAGTIDIPAQGAMGLALEGFVIDGADATFAIAGVPGDPVFVGTVVPGEMTGTFTQNGIGVPFRLTREANTGPPRPQEPKPPFPYQSEDVTCHNGEIKLAGTLTLPYAPGPCAAVLLISGSGPQDRNEEIMGHKPFLVLADHLTRAGIAVLRMDDRGVGESTGSRIDATSDDYAEDALAAVAYLAQRPEIDPERIGAVGHSEGGLIAPIMAIRSEQVAFIVLLAGTGVPGEDIILRQIELINRADGLPEDRVAAAVEAQREIFSLVRQDVSEADLRARLVEIMKDQAEPGTPEELLLGKAREDARIVLTPWFRHFIEFDPRAVLRKVEVPVLAICGEKDLQVDPKQSLPEIAKALDEAGNADVTVWEMPGLNHLFQTAGTGSPAEYYAIEETFAPAALETLADWITSRF